MVWANHNSSEGKCFRLVVFKLKTTADILIINLPKKGRLNRFTEINSDTGLRRRYSRYNLRDSSAESARASVTNDKSADNFPHIKYRAGVTLI